MTNSSGGQLRISIKSTDIITIAGRNINLYRVLYKLDFIDKIIVSNRTRVMMIDRSVSDAIKIYVAAGGYGGLKLADYLRKVFA